jgi:hypothetical protein
VSRRRDPLAGVNLLELAPRRLAAWSEVEGRVVVERPRPRGRGWRRLKAALAYRFAVRRIRLDEVGSAAWLGLDGRATVGEVAGELRARFGAAIEPAEERLGQLVRLLRREGLLAYPDWDDGPPG